MGRLQIGFSLDCMNLMLLLTSEFYQSSCSLKILFRLPAMCSCIAALPSVVSLPASASPASLPKIFPCCLGSFWCCGLLQQPVCGQCGERNARSQSLKWWQSALQKQFQQLAWFFSRQWNTATKKPKPRAWGFVILRCETSRKCPENGGTHLKRSLSLG